MTTPFGEPPGEDQPTQGLPPEGEPYRPPGQYPPGPAGQYPDPPGPGGQYPGGGYSPGHYPGGNYPAGQYPAGGYPPGPAAPYPPGSYPPDPPGHYPPGGYPPGQPGGYPPAGYPAGAGPRQWAPGMPPGPPPRRRRTGLIVAASIGGVLVLVVVALAVIGLAAGPGTGPPQATATKSGAAPSAAPEARTLSLPGSAAGYHRMSGNVAQRLVARMRQQAAGQAAPAGRTWARAFQQAKISLYTRPGQQLIFMGFSTAGNPQLSALLRRSPSTGLDGFFAGAGAANTKDFPAGPLGGILRCGVASRAGTQLTICAWTDPSVLGVTMVPGTPLRRLARVTRVFRAAAEH